MPQYQVAECHQTLVRAAPSAVYAAVRETDLASSPATRLLFTLRVLPAAVITLVRSPRAALADWRERRAQRGWRLADFERAGFRIVAERVSEELVIGLLGRFRTPRGAICHDVRPGSGLIRRSMRHAIRRRAEQCSRPTSTSDRDAT